jgi:hypothetical protein
MAVKQLTGRFVKLEAVHRGQVYDARREFATLGDGRLLAIRQGVDQRPVYDNIGSPVLHQYLHWLIALGDPPRVGV